MNILLHGINISAQFQTCILQLIQAFEEKGSNVKLTKNLFNSFRKKGGLSPIVTPLNSKNDLAGIDVVISIGGDGTLLDTISLIGAYEIPVLGINTGRMGFLATIAKEDIKAAVKDLLEGHYALEDRSLVRLESSVPLFKGLNFGLNEFTIHKRDTSSMITVHTYIDGDYLNSYWADGIIVSTPTGSTGYSLSCGGPLISPLAKNFVITPVSPHNLNVRPIVVSDDSEISFKIEGRSEKFLVSLDSRSAPIDASVELKVKKELFVAKLVKFHNYSFFDTLRQKLNWGYDMRN
ncbi:NAD kinase [Cyclobacterium marinum]|uniref:NAD kinase n=1 Tax=Cyclobacterium marinum (strain ATCC 25205 / DSM 745 / LMG 13164 / NCIMB 1802) TaxID=880070 RepID=G0IX55_CYCMS|nr:NAD kinase [Cyclobacterium marinum]AEL25603.1 inorganic polyphosphate/ATP-NAD kinase [Cyclobacterium marinum DSM 745]MBI0401035.1 NAD kinase [Cyclobacterium marinum]MBR9774759.1 NAD kinase [Cytophagales bacterium]|tara:strand:+ start:17918 stop:18793 length:876 start_codon:yes stop_codon:yes gene_type:complete